jgi:lysophospholipase L1-like esterase
MNWETILSLGDSITFGARSYLGYPEVCGQLLKEKLNKHWNIINHATNGYTVIELVRSLNTVMEDYKQNYPNLITILIGTNDIKNNTSQRDFRIAYNQLITKAMLLAVNNNILIIRIPRFTTKVFYPYNFEMNNRIIEFNGIVGSIAKENGLRTIDFKLTDDDFYDGVHFSASGSENAGKQLANFILMDKGFESTAGLS